MKKEVFTMPKKIKHKLWIILALCLIWVALLGIYVLFPHSNNQLSINAIDYSNMIKGILSSNNDVPSPSITPEADQMETLINNYLIQNSISDASIQYCIEDLETHTRYVHNENENVFAASIYKLPLAMIYYEKIHAGEYTLDTLFTYEANHYEAGGPIGNVYAAGEQIALSELLHDLILYSDNTAGHILFENLGGWIAFKEAISKYSDVKQDDYFYSYDNVLNAAFVSDVLAHLYEHSDDYTQLIANLKMATPDAYLATDVKTDIAQKYGNYGMYNNAAGIVYGNHPYTIVIFTSLGNQNTVIGDINAICYTYFNGNSMK